MTTIHVIVNVGPKGFPFIDACLASLKMQDHRDWCAHITCEPDDETYYHTRNAIRHFFGGSRQAALTVNYERQYVLKNTVDAIRRSGAEYGDVIAILDGDDQLARYDALSIVAKQYERGAWVTYGSFVSNRYPYPSMMPAYPEGADLRSHTWLGTHLRTFKRGLFDLIHDEDFKDDGGEWLTCCPDLAIMLPCLEMAGPRARHIPLPLVLYNRASPFAVADTRKEDQKATAALIRSREPYKRLGAL